MALDTYCMITLADYKSFARITDDQIEKNALSLYCNAGDASAGTVTKSGNLLTLIITAGVSAGTVNIHLAEIQQTITIWADAGGVPNEVTATSNGIEAAGLLAGDFVTITGTTNYNGTYEVQSVTANTFNIQHADAGDDAAGTVTVINYDNLADLATYLETLSGWTANLLGEGRAASTDLKNVGSTGALGSANEMTLIYYDNWTLERIVDRASHILEIYLNRNILSRSYTNERYDGIGKEVMVRNFPIQAITYISSGYLNVIRARYTVTTVHNAYIAVTTTGVILNVDGSPTTLLFSSYATMTLLAAAINNQAGWEANTIGSLYDAYPSTLLYEHPNRFCINEFCDLDIPDEPMVDYKVDLARGIIYYPGGWFRGFQNIFVSYTGGFSTTPYCLMGAVCRIAKVIDDRRRTDEAMKSEKMGDYSYTTVDVEKELSPADLIEVKGYRNYNISGA